jgi:serine-type D-Ala-D-Ala carboxypeptidase/endopeptidase (penicillin-binding protein 4)
MNDMRTIFSIVSLLISNIIFAQDVSKQLQEKIAALEKDPQFKHAIVSMYVVDSKTGKVIFEKNSEIGLAPASCQKVITSVSAFELLGKGYRYKTEIGIGGTQKDTLLDGNVYITGYGDPTLGSWRFDKNSGEKFMNNLNTVLTKLNIKNYFNIVIDDSKWGTSTIPNGWIWEDIGNYYGAGASAFNWHENQYDIVLQAGKKVGDKVDVVSTYWNDRFHRIRNELTTAKEGSGDNAYIFLPEVYGTQYLRGTIPLSSKPITISGAWQNGFDLFRNEISENQNYFQLRDKLTKVGFRNNSEGMYPLETKLYTHYSPTLDSINYWFLKKSINLYGEAFVKTIGYEKKGVGATDTGLSIIKYFWKQRGIEPSAINIIDGSGLSPANRVTANALVTVMQYAQKQNWYSSFYNALPEMNSIKMKDGYISGVRSYTGYIKSKTGNEYTFALIVNNFDGSAGTVREKLWRVLDEMK